MFLDLPFTIYRDIPQWTPPLDFEARAALDRKRNPYFSHSDAAFFLALQGEVPLGRLAVLDNRHYNEYNHDRRAFFFLFECINDVELSRALFNAAAAWCKKRGLTTLYGPKGFSALDGLGCLVHGFEHPSAFGISYNPPYYANLLEESGLQPEADILSGYLSSAVSFPEKIHQVAQRVQERRGLTVTRFTNRAQLQSFLPNLYSLYNLSIQGTPGNAPITRSEADTLAKQILWFADPRLIKIIMKDDRPVGFLFAYPDIAQAVRRCRGHLFPLGWLWILREMRTTKMVDLNGAGIIEEFRGLGGTALLFSEMHKSILEGGFQHCEIIQIGANNHRMLNELRGLGVDFYKTHRMFIRTLEGEP